MSMTRTPGFSADSPRIRELVERFREIGETSMRDLPLYNPDLEVESVGFRTLEDQWVGVLITPWFMNLLRLPKQKARMDMARIGRKAKATLPSGEHQLMQGGDEVIGSYESLSLHSPMSAFKTQEAAREEAIRRLTDLMRPSHDPPPGATGRLRAEPKKMSRRDFLRGTRPEA